MWLKFKKSVNLKLKMNYYLFNVLKGKFKIEFKKSVQYNDKRYVNTQHHITEQNTIEICAKEN